MEKYIGARQVYIEDSEEGQTWNNPLESLMYLMAYMVGLGNVWKFPSLAAKYGGGTFLVAYILMIVIIGFPILFMELALGQYSKTGPLDLYGNIAPLFRGLGFCTVVTLLLNSIYYNVVISWFIYYLVASFQYPLPWADSNMNNSEAFDNNIAEMYFNDTFLGYDASVNNWFNFGDLQWQRVLCLLAAWSLVWFLFFIDRIGKIRAYFLGIAPFFTLLISMIFGATLEGAGSGIELYITPKWENFGNFEVNHF